jgi:formylglycine-generating enzyme required for sulfatase activity
MTGEPAVRGTDSRLTLLPEAGIVLVLLPAGRVPVENGEKPTSKNEVVLDPFFLSKYEMTVAQWERAQMWRWIEIVMPKGQPLLPVRDVSLDDCVATLERAGLFLRLPTVAQWEYGCRAGTTTPWWTGAEEETLQGAANIGTGYLKPVGELLPNPFGLHDVHGNVPEWCCDDFGDEGVPVRPGDGETETSVSRYRAVLGGGADRSGQGVRAFPEYGAGLRVARPVTP